MSALIYHKPICKLCGKDYYKLYNLKRHIVTIHGFNYQEYLENFETKNVVEIPVKLVDNDNTSKLVENNKQCSKCNKVFARKWNLTKHTEKCKGVIDRYSCEYCKKQFTHGNSRYKHILNCKTKKEIDAKALIKNNEEHKDNEAKDINIEQQRADTINNNVNSHNTTNNTINNYILQFPEDGDNKFEFSIEHITDAVMTKLLNKVQHPQFKFNNFLDKLMDEPKNRIIKKSSPNTSYSQIHKGDGNWELGYDKDIYRTFTHHVTVAASEKIDDIQKDVKLVKELYHNLKNFEHYVKEVNEMDYDSNKYNDITSRIKLIIINLSRRWEAENV
jgi:hypothetical protein